MMRLLAPGLALLAGVAIGAFAVHGLHAQATPPAYVITEIDVADNKMDTFLKDYAPLIQPTFQPFGGHYIIRGGNTVTFDGSPPKRIVVRTFDSMKKGERLASVGGLQNPYPDDGSGIDEHSSLCR
jgi:uncharacterized protein (DUF1330 family)